MPSKLVLIHEVPNPILVTQKRPRVHVILHLAAPCARTPFTQAISISISLPALHAGQLPSPSPFSASSPSRSLASPSQYLHHPHDLPLAARNAPKAAPIHRRICYFATTIAAESHHRHSRALPEKKEGPEQRDPSLPGCREIGDEGCLPEPEKHTVSDLGCRIQRTLWIEGGSLSTKAAVTFDFDSTEGRHGGSTLGIGSPSG
ncbi:hypothetical protein MRB53_009507 [Persea americana]|uniref:Uncharacterized protein n=1 Tax=Persea americana TaxID=3435 RepID=A0ACC2LPJ9_PERAE|nr:hypothetical protein MRB53_009507 [Persea americana]